MAATLEPVLDADREYEIVDGQPEEKVKGGALHGGVGARLIGELWGHVKTNHLGGIYGADTTFMIGENQRLPDIAFVATSRIPWEGEPEGIWPIAPDLAIEIVSPTDLYLKLVSKVHDYLAAGVHQVWLVSVEHRTVTVYASRTDARIFQETDEIAGGDLIPGFRLEIAELFHGPAHQTK